MWGIDFYWHMWEYCREICWNRAVNSDLHNGFFNLTEKIAKNAKIWKNRKNAYWLLQFDRKKLAKCKNKNSNKKMKFDIFNKCLTVVCNFLQCDYCQIENVSMNFSSPLVTENSFQITRLCLVIWKDFLSLVVRKNPYSHFLLTAISQCWGYNVILKTWFYTRLSMILH